MPLTKHILLSSFGKFRVGDGDAPRLRARVPADGQDAMRGPAEVVVLGDADRRMVAAVELVAGEGEDVLRVVGVAGQELRTRFLCSNGSTTRPRSELTRRVTSYCSLSGTEPTIRL